MLTISFKRHRFPPEFIRHAVWLTMVSGRPYRLIALRKNLSAALDVSLEKTHVCVLDRNGTVVFESAVVSSPGAILSALNEAPSCERVVFETGRMAPMLYHGPADLGVPVVCIESRQA